MDWNMLMAIFTGVTAIAVVIALVVAVKERRNWCGLGDCR